MSAATLLRTITMTFVILSVPTVEAVSKMRRWADDKILTDPTGTTGPAETTLGVADADEFLCVLLLRHVPLLGRCLHIMHCVSGVGGFSYSL
jgi:hypothetical protein